MNLFPVFANANTGRQATFEKMVKDAIGTKDVCVVIRLDYSDSDTVFPARPTSIHYAVYIDGVESKLEYTNDFAADAYSPVSVTGRKNFCRKLPY
ncbi:unnamed protein product [Tuwongella immobilis]|uniref:Uncharacterized protein n=2 Tax=Tuwongella immobilis TaxID=692036 RepID=A0A6C2YRY2_9BACT|nr:unnamed protein product [Tuwongella immobilis]VTS04838.1 unnamed protein product [Tuwongella immobilis]